MNDQWKNRAACNGMGINAYPDPWFPDDDDKIQRPTELAAKVCGMCPVRRECLLDALHRNEQYGTWGGLTRKQRVSLCRPRNRVKCPICSGRFVRDTTGQPIQACMSCGITWRSKHTRQ